MPCKLLQQQTDRYLLAEALASPSPQTHHIDGIRAWDLKQALLVETRGQGLGLEGARVLQLLHGWEGSLLTVRVSHRET